MTNLTSAASTATITDHDRLIGNVAWISAWFALIMGQLHALARHRTEDGKSDLDSPLVRAWAEPAGDLLSPLLTWAEPYVVYTTYGKLWLPVLAALALAAFVAYRHRAPQGFEKWVWRVVLFGYVGTTVAVLGEYWTQWGNDPNPLLDAVFIGMIPFVLITMIGSTVLGVTLLVKQFRPRSAAILLALSVPGLIVISTITSLGNIFLPIAFAFGILGRRWARA